MIKATDIFDVFKKVRGDAIVLASGLAGFRHWEEYTDNPKRDAGSIVESMGSIGPFALGLALAQPDEKVVLFDSEGSLLMNLGSLVTTAGQLPKNFYHFLLDNESYATTGGQPVPNAQNVDYEGLARESGYASVCSIDDVEEFAGRLPEILDGQGPVFVAMKIVPEIENVPVGLREFTITRTAVEVICDLREELGVDGE